ncbi:serine hydrolase [Plantactinospora soyae]|uniref:Beta-lactamase n=1 Tax=Plantactinospora soyae TaxID=1544732 RepID=A0A927MDP3_9ACTN|nr:serine hydrolase [Plantactinospora soyae]MBE1492828.1 beta-lactamase class A [Plantactinospora soyae]
MANRRGLGRREVLVSAATALAGLGVLGTGLARRWADPSVATPVVPGPTATPVRPSPTPDHQAIARARLEKHLKEIGGRIGLAVRDQVTGLEVTVGTRRFQTASIVKVDILAALLLRRQTQGGELSQTERQLARSMIVASDNDAASSLWQTIGYRAGLTAANRTLGLRATTPNPSWGMTTTTAADQLRLLASIVTPGSPLTGDSRALLLGFMRQVRRDQRWGITAAAGPDSTASYVKNGWTTVDADQGRWLVNSVGRITEPGRDWLIAVLSDHHASQSAGITVVEGVARYALTELRRVPGSATVPS